MLKKKMYWAAVALVLCLALAFWQFRSEPESQTLRESSKTSQVGPSPTVSIAAENTDVDETRQEFQAACLTLEQIEFHPAFMEEALRWESVSVKGPTETIAAYRGVSATTLEIMAAQGDSAAMAVRGAVSLMRAFRHDDERAVPYLLLEDTSLVFGGYKRPHSPEFLEHNQEAREWFYKAAMHGRVMALTEVGFTVFREFGSAVELGWIDEEAYNALPRAEQNALLPPNVYTVAAFSLVSELDDGPAGEILGGMMPRSPIQQEPVDRLVTQFQRDVRDAGVQPIIMEPYTGPTMDELRKQLCPGEWERASPSAGNGQD